MMDRKTIKSTKNNKDTQSESEHKVLLEELLKAQKNNSTVIEQIRNEIKFLKKSQETDEHDENKILNIKFNGNNFEIDSSELKHPNHFIINGQAIYDQISGNENPQTNQNRTFDEINIETENGEILSFKCKKNTKETETEIPEDTIEKTNVNPNYPLTYGGLFFVFIASNVVSNIITKILKKK